MKCSLLRTWSSSQTTYCSRRVVPRLRVELLASANNMRFLNSSPAAARDCIVTQPRLSALPRSLPRRITQHVGSTRSRPSDEKCSAAGFLHHSKNIRGCCAEMYVNLASNESMATLLLWKEMGDGADESVLQGRQHPNTTRSLATLNRKS